MNVDPATVVLPTGVGKTETMLSVLVAEQCGRLMVVVPTDALRTQISEKFFSLRYTMRAGSDVELGISEAQKQKAIKANFFGQGFENGRRSSIGCSYKGRIWSYRTANLLTLTTWCRAVGARLLDENLDPEEVLRGTLVPQLVAERPKRMPIAVEWPDIFYKEPEQVFWFEIDGITVYRHDADLGGSPKKQSRAVRR